MSLEVDWEGLVVGFESRSRRITHFFDKQTGEVVQVLEKDAGKHAALTADTRYLALPRDRGERSRGDLEEFAALCDDPAARRDLGAALSAEDFASAYRAALLRHPREEARFFEFKQRRARERADEWLAGSGIAFEKTPTPPERR